MRRGLQYLNSTARVKGPERTWSSLSVRFRDLALDCYDEKGEEALVEICIGNMSPEEEGGLIKHLQQRTAAVSNNKRKERGRLILRVPCSDEEFHAILDAMFADGAIKPPRPYKNPSREDKTDPRYCRYHQIVGHPTTACQTLRKILHGKIQDGTLELPSKKQAIDEDPLPPPTTREGNSCGHYLFERQYGGRGLP
ncbi:hypothetical protein M0R45_009294 [Rubus argutus]|uniref:Uncharacterized protein n=1 Tax=Rubus argutus TaxID=59490 RepID=A0AAW1Y723_RUBAR